MHILTMLPPPAISILGSDQGGKRKHRINANSFQQQALTTAHGWQYATFYTPKPTSNAHAHSESQSPSQDSPNVECGESRSASSEPLYVNVSRRKIGGVAWENMVLDDYEQREDDGHNTISLGVCEGDGTLHLAFDHHCDHLRFRISKAGLATQPGDETWDASLFGPVLDRLPGLATQENLSEVTYPRFLSVGDDLILTHRIGQAGLGADVLHHYSSTTHAYTYTSTPLVGIASSPYINGISVSYNPSSTPSPKSHVNYPSTPQTPKQLPDPTLHLTWCYRHFIPYPTFSDPSSTTHKAQAGPNGPENNEGLYYTSSPDLGKTWKSSDGTVIASVSQSHDNDIEELEDGNVSAAPASPRQHNDQSPKDSTSKGTEHASAEVLLQKLESLGSLSGDGSNSLEDKMGEVTKGTNMGNSSPTVSSSIFNNTKGTCVFPIPRDSGVLNQESQAVDSEGGVWVLNRERRRDVGMRWMVYWRRPQGPDGQDGAWSEHVLEMAAAPRPTETGNRGCIAVHSPPGNAATVYVVLPSNDPADQAGTLTILAAGVPAKEEAGAVEVRSSGVMEAGARNDPSTVIDGMNTLRDGELERASKIDLNVGTSFLDDAEDEGVGEGEEMGRNVGLDWKLVWQGNDFDGEPLVDEKRLEDGVLSVFTHIVDGRVVVLDFEL